MGQRKVKLSDSASAQLDSSVIRVSNRCFLDKNPPEALKEHTQVDSCFYSEALMLVSSKGEPQSNNNCSWTCFTSLLLTCLKELILFFPIWAHHFPYSNSKLYIFLSAWILLSGFASGLLELEANQSEDFPASLPIPHKAKSFESSVGVLVLPELRYSRVCFIMVLGPLQPDISHPGEKLHSAPIYQSRGWGRQNDTVMLLRL